ncbi:MAG: aspartate ammonia-lyase [Lachnospiraceae bacterium]|nr:aspartate ammonia-lyase [Lachnospiraceae bacterium]
MKKEMRMETDSIGTMEVPKEAYYGVQALRAKQNFPISGMFLNSVFIENLAKVKKAAAITNRKINWLDGKKAEAIIKACEEVIDGKFNEEFIVDAIQGGAGTSANMNMNEVIANRANEFLGGTKGSYSKVHPNDHVNMCQSTNDVIPTAGKLTVIHLAKELIGELEKLEKELLNKSQEFDDVLKMGRTQLQDAVPMRVGQTFHAYAAMISRDIKRIKSSMAEMYTLNLGGTAIGSGVNADSGYIVNIVPCLGKITGYPLTQAEDLFDATQNLDGFVMVSGVLKACAVNLSKMCNDLRLLSSGPKTGIGELHLPERQNGSSIMPGKINPVIQEVVNQVAFHVIGHDNTITLAAEAGQMELNAFEPIVFYNLFESLSMLKQAVNTLTNNCIKGIKVNKERCYNMVNESAGIATVLCPYIGYAKSAKVVKTALKTGKSVRAIVLEKGIMSEKALERALDPYSATQWKEVGQKSIS